MLHQKVTALSKSYTAIHASPQHASVSFIRALFAIENNPTAKSLASCRLEHGIEEVDPLRTWT
jgi:hypothetical protein